MSSSVDQPEAQTACRLLVFPGYPTATPIEMRQITQTDLRLGLEIDVSVGGSASMITRSISRPEPYLKSSNVRDCSVRLHHFNTT